MVRVAVPRHSPDPLPVEEEGINNSLAGVVANLLSPLSPLHSEGNSSPRSNPPASPKYRWNPYTHPAPNAPTSSTVDCTPTSAAQTEVTNNSVAMPTLDGSSFSLDPSLTFHSAQISFPATIPPIQLSPTGPQAALVHGSGSFHSPVGLLRNRRDSEGSASPLSAELNNNSVQRQSFVLPLSRDQADNAYSALNQLRTQKKDTALFPLLNQLPPATRDDIYSLLLQSPELVLELCEKERGNIIVQLIELRGGENSVELAQAVVEQGPRLVVNQSGCIAFARVFDVVPELVQRMMSEFVVNQFHQLAMHPYGNYAVQRVLKANHPLDMLAVQAKFLYKLPESAMELSGNKFGSHVMESFLLNCEVQVFKETMQQLLQHATLTAHLCNNRFANYVLQSAMRRATSVLDPATKDQLVNVIKPHLYGCQFAQNIVKSWSSGAGEPKSKGHGHPANPNAGGPGPSHQYHGAHSNGGGGGASNGVGNFPSPGTPPPSAHQQHGRSVQLPQGQHVPMSVTASNSLPKPSYGQVGGRNSQPASYHYAGGSQPAPVYAAPPMQFASAYPPSQVQQWEQPTHGHHGGAQFSQHQGGHHWGPAPTGFTGTPSPQPEGWQVQTPPPQQGPPSQGYPPSNFFFTVPPAGQGGHPSASHHSQPLFSTPPPQPQFTSTTTTLKPPQPFTLSQSTVSSSHSHASGQPPTYYQWQPSGPGHSSQGAWSNPNQNQQPQAWAF